MLEGEPFPDQGVLEEQNMNTDISIFVLDMGGKVVGRVLNFPVDEGTLRGIGKTPVLRTNRDGRLLLCAAVDVEMNDSVLGRLCLVRDLESEAAFLKLIGFLLIGANFVGAAAALLVGHVTGRRMLAPIGRMIEDANRIGSASLDDRLEIPEPDDELRRLALTINGMLDRVSWAYRQQGRFVADVSHELRTPLAILQGNVDLLARWGGEDPEVWRGCVAALRRQTEYMGRLVESLLFLARCDNARYTLAKTTFFVKGLFAELIEEQSLLDEQHAYRTLFAADDDSLYADRNMVKQLLRALIDNSVQYTPAGGTIRLEFRRDAGAVSLRVSDDGAGMDGEHLAHIFERFYRVDRARTRATGGMGLGLSIVAAIAEAHGGRVHAESEKGRGTAVTVTLPQAQTLTGFSSVAP